MNVWKEIIELTFYLLNLRHLSLKKKLKYNNLLKYDTGEM